MMDSIAEADLDQLENNSVVFVHRWSKKPIYVHGAETFESLKLYDPLVEDFEFNGESFKDSLMYMAFVSNVVFKKCNMRKFDSRNSSFVDCVFEDCDFKGASFRGTTFTNCRIVNSDFKRIDFDRVKFNNCEISKSVVDSGLKQSKYLTSCGFAEEKNK